MLSSLKTRKIARIAATSAALGATVALLFVGAPADAAVMIAKGRGI